MYSTYCHQSICIMLNFTLFLKLLCNLRNFFIWSGFATQMMRIRISKSGVGSGSVFTKKSRSGSGFSEYESVNPTAIGKWETQLWLYFNFFLLFFLGDRCDGTDPHRTGRQQQPSTHRTRVRKCLGQGKQSSEFLFPQGTVSFYSSLL
jgi:hypothetical protein